MRLRHLLFALIAATVLRGPAASAQARTPILVELFTSEGCSSCPPADALLARLLQEQPLAGAEIIALGEHVDYWDGLGWRDRFSSAAMTARQNQYASRFHLDGPYTPQMVVDGGAQFVGNDPAQAREALARAAHAVKVPLTLSAPVRDGRHFAATVSLAMGTGSPAGEAGLYAALVDPMDATEVRRGENTGRRLQHVAVVRTLARIGSLKDLGRGTPLNFALTAPEASDPAAMQVIVFAQRSVGRTFVGPVVGAVTSAATATTVPPTAQPTAIAARQRLE